MSWRAGLEVALQLRAADPDLVRAVQRLHALIQRANGSLVEGLLAGGHRCILRRSVLAKQPETVRIHDEYASKP